MVWISRMSAQLVFFEVSSCHRAQKSMSSDIMTKVVIHLHFKDPLIQHCTSPAREGRYLPSSLCNCILQNPRWVRRYARISTQGMGLVRIRVVMELAVDQVQQRALLRADFGICCGRSKNGLGVGPVGTYLVICLFVSSRLYFSNNIPCI